MRARTGQRLVASQALRPPASATFSQQSSPSRSPAEHESGAPCANACARAGVAPTPAQVERGSYSSAVVSAEPPEPPEAPALPELEPPIEPTRGSDSPLAEYTSQAP